jgi:hypothetical protein
VPDGTSRLRLAVMASHTKSELRWAAEVLAGVIGATQPRPEPEYAPPEPEYAPPEPEPARRRIYDGFAEAA